MNFNSPLIYFGSLQSEKIPQSAKKLPDYKIFIDIEPPEKNSDSTFSPSEVCFVTYDSLPSVAHLIRYLFENNGYQRSENYHVLLIGDRSTPYSSNETLLKKVKYHASFLQKKLGEEKDDKKNVTHAPNWRTFKKVSIPILEISILSESYRAFAFQVALGRTALLVDQPLKLQRAKELLLQSAETLKEGGTFPAAIDGQAYESPEFAVLSSLPMPYGLIQLTDGRDDFQPRVLIGEKMTQILRRIRLKKGLNLLNSFASKVLPISPCKIFNSASFVNINNLSFDDTHFDFDKTTTVHIRKGATIDFIVR